MNCKNSNGRPQGAEVGTISKCSRLQCFFSPFFFVGFQMKNKLHHICTSPFIAKKPINKKKLFGKIACHSVDYRTCLLPLQIIQKKNIRSFLNCYQSNKVSCKKTAKSVVHQGCRLVRCNILKFFEMVFICQHL